MKLLLIALLGVIKIGWAAPATLDMHFHGVLVAEPCVIPPGSEEIRLDFGSTVDKYLYENSRTLAKPFEIQLAECDISLGKTVRVMFSGTESIALPGLLALDGGSEASGIAIGLETQDGQALALNQQSRGQEISDGNNTIMLQAYVKGEPEAITNKTIGRGMFTAVATFALEYE